MADAERLQQVLSNLLGNSLKFTERGAINLSLRVRARSSDNRVRVSFAVRDTGPGIDPDEIERLFEPFAKGRAGQRHRAGAGLGLAISADLVRLMGGQIQVDSAPGKGAQFRFELTLETCAANLDTTERFERAQGTGLHVLMVDDDEDVALALRSQLEGARMRGRPGRLRPRRRAPVWPARTTTWCCWMWNSPMATGPTWRARCAPPRRTWRVPAWRSSRGIRRRRCCRRASTNG
ncbi:MAG: ATP-binding protein [Gemmatimonadales bacterium]